MRSRAISGDTRKESARSDLRLRLLAARSVSHRRRRVAASRARPPPSSQAYLRSAAAAALRGARRGEGLEGEELIRHECGRPVERLVDAVAPAQAALKVGLSAQRRIRHTDGCDAPQTEARHFAHENEPEPPLDGGRDKAARLFRGARAELAPPTVGDALSADLNEGVPIR